MTWKRGSREGSDPGDGMLHGLHGDMCEGGSKEYSTARPVVHSDGRVDVIYMEWCGDCGACAYEVV